MTGNRTIARLVPAGEVAAMLAAQAGRIASEIFPKGRLCGHEYRVGSLAGEPGQSLSICVHGQKAGIWRDFAGDAGGDLLDLAAHALFGGDKKAAYRWALQWLGIDNRDPAAIDRARRTAPRAVAQASPAAADDKRAGVAFALWLEARELKRGDPVDRYLRGRGINLAALGRQPRALRYHPACRCAEADAPLPAMLGLVVSLAGKPTAVHRTYLQVQADGHVAKAAVPNPKKSLGRLGGGAIRLWRGGSGKALRDAPYGESVVVTEGVENGLSVALAAPERRVLAAGSLANMGALKLPASIRRVIIFADNDGTNAAAARGLQRAIDHFAYAGHDVAVARPPADVKDANDLLRGVRQAVA